MVSAKGKEKVTDSGGKGKRKWRGGDDDDKSGRKRKNREVLQFFDDQAYDVDEDEDSSDDSSLGSGFSEEEEIFDSQYKVNNEPGKASHFPFVKEEVMSEDELDRLFEERYKPGSGLVRYEEDNDEHKNSMEGDRYVPSAKDPTIWKVKCMMGRERYSALCLMQKYADMTYLGNKMQIISACALDHFKGFVVIEADNCNDIYEACKGLSTIYSSKATAVPSNEISRLLSVRSKSSAISEGMWARVKNGRYKGDLAQVVAVNDVRKKVTVKLIPRIDLKSMAGKFGGGLPAKRTDIPAQRLITASELVEFHPLIQIRRDRDTNLVFEILDGNMLKDGYLYKKISMDSLSFWGVMPTEDELLKFEPAKKDESTDAQWLTQLFGEKKKKEVERAKPKLGSKGDKGGGKSEGSSGTNYGHNFELHDLVFIGRKDFGVVLGSGKDDSVQVIREGPDGPLVVDAKPSDLKLASFDRKLFTVLDKHSNTLTVNGDCRVLDGPLKGRQGIIKKIYKGILFLYDESESENNGYMCVKAQLCEKVNLSGDDPSAQDDEPVDNESAPSVFADLMSSPKSSLSPDKSLQEMDSKSKFARDDNEMFSVGQSLRIRVGPLKGYICRVLAVRRSDVTVKLDSKHKIITVKSDHLSEVRGRNPIITQGEDSGSANPFDFLGGQESSRDWMDGAALSTEDNKWNAGGSTEKTSWSAVPSLSQSGSGEPADNNAKKEDSSWQVKETPGQSSSWGAAAANTGWGKLAVPQLGNSGESLKDDSWGKAAEKWNSGGDTSANKAVCGQCGTSSEKETGGALNQPQTSSWGKVSDGTSLVTGAWGNAGGASNADPVRWAVPADKQDSTSKGWGASAGGALNADPVGWAVPADKKDCTSKGWGASAGGASNADPVGWAVPADKQGSTSKGWGASAGGASNADPVGWAVPSDKQDSTSKGWGAGKGHDAAATDNNQTDSWNKQSSGGDIKSSWGKSEGSSSWSKQDCGSSFGKKDGESSLGKSVGQSTWGQQSGANAEDNTKGWADQNKKFEALGGDQGSGGWKKGGWGNRDDTGQERSWGRPPSFDSGRGSGGRRGRGGGHGGRDNYGRGRSFDQSQSNSWNKDSQCDAGKTSSWSRNPAGGWGNSVVNDGSKEKSDEPAWNTGSNANKDGESGQGWGGTKPNEDSKPSGWNVSKSSNDSGLSGWGKPSNANEVAGAADGGFSNWDKIPKSNENKSSWNAATTSLDGNPSSDWGKGGNGGNQKAPEENAWNKSLDGKDGSSSSWNSAKSNDGSSTGWKSNGGSSTGWGQSNWAKGGTRESGGNQDSPWSSKSNWSSGSGYGDDNNQGGGRGGSWRGRGGRGDCGGFRGRGGYDSGSFGGRGGLGRGRFGGRGSDKGDYGGRGGSDREGFRGKGGFRGRGRGDWSNRDDNSNQDRSSRWGDKGSNESEGWKSSGYGYSWKPRDGDNGSSSSWNQSKDNTSSWGSWNSKSNDNNQRDTPEKAAGSSWGASWNNSVTGGTNKDVASDSWGKAETNASEKSAGSSWGAPPANGSSSASWNSSETGGPTKDGASESWGKAAKSTVEKLTGNSWVPPENKNSLETADNKDQGASDSWGKAAATSSWEVAKEDGESKL